MHTFTIGWFAALIVFGIIEASCPCLLSIWFCAGSIGAMVAAELGASFGVQLAVFLVISLIALAALRPLLRRYYVPKLEKTNADALIGKCAVVTERVDNLNATGRAKVGGQDWSVRSSAGDILEPGTTVTIERIEGAKLFVSPAQEPASANAK